MDLTGAKGILKSVTTWGGVIAALPAVIEFVDKVVASGVLPPEVSATVSAFGGLLAILGRVKATKKIQGIV